MKRTDTFAIDTRAGSGDISAAVRITRWLPGVIWSDLAKSRPAQFTVRYDDQTTSAAAIVSALKERDCHCVIIAVIPIPLFSQMHRPLVRLARQFRASPNCCCRAQLLSCVRGVVAAVCKTTIEKAEKMNSWIFATDKNPCCPA